MRAMQERYLCQARRAIPAHRSPPASESAPVWADMQIKTICSRASYTPRPDRTRKALPGGLTVEQQDAVKALVKSRVEILPHDAQAKGSHHLLEQHQEQV